MKWRVEKYSELSNRQDGGFDFHKGGRWQFAFDRKTSAVGIRNLCYSLTKNNATATRVVNPANGAVMVTFKYNHPNKVVVTYNSLQFERLIMESLSSESEQKQE